MGSLPCELRVLGSFWLGMWGVPLEVPSCGQKLLAYLALDAGPGNRMALATALWPERDTRRATGNLRSLLWRLKGLYPGLLRSSDGCVSLSTSMHLDLAESRVEAARLLNADRQVADWDVKLTVLTADILTDWYDDWVIIERERFRQLRLHALERASVLLTAAGRHAEAIDVGLSAVAAEPLRESAHLVVIRAHLAEGNRIEAVRQYDRLRKLLRSELGAEPGPAVRQCVGSVIAR